MIRGEFMSPYRIEMFVSSYTKDKMPLYTVKVYSKDGKIIEIVGCMSKETAVRHIAEYCCVEL